MTAILRGESTERPGGVSLSGATYRRRFLVRTTSIYDGPHTVVRCDGLPQMLTRYITPSGEEDPTALVIDIQAVPRESPTEWYADVEYGPVDQELVAGGGSDNPLNRPIEISGGLAQYSRLITKALNIESQRYETIQNSAGDAYAAQEIPDSRPELEITRNLAGFSLHAVAHFKDTVNSDLFLGVFPPGTMRMQYIGFRRQQFAGFVYNEVTAHIEYAETHDIELLDEGFHRKFPGQDRERIEVEGVGGRLIFPTEPQLLNGAGDVKQAGQDAQYRRYRWSRWTRFNDLLT